MVTEAFVVYLFSRLHEKLGFQRILEFNYSFPDCIAERDHRQVSIEFEVWPNSLVHHLPVASYDPFCYSCFEDIDKNFVVTEKTSKIVVTKYPLDQFRIERHDNNFVDVFYRKLPIDCCVCWEKRGTLKTEFAEVEIIELKNLPCVIKFMQKKGYEF